MEEWAKILAAVCANLDKNYRTRLTSVIVNTGFCTKYVFHAIKWKLFKISYNVIFWIFFYSVSHGRGVPTIKITDLSILCKLKNRQCIKYFFAPL